MKLKSKMENCNWVVLEEPRQNPDPQQSKEMPRCVLDEHFIQFKELMVLYDRLVIPLESPTDGLEVPRYVILTLNRKLGAAKDTQCKS